MSEGRADLSAFGRFIRLNHGGLVRLNHGGGPALYLHFCPEPHQNVLRSGYSGPEFLLSRFAKAYCVNESQEKEGNRRRLAIEPEPVIMRSGFIET
ncbi:MAG TPA: hypothetical protein VMW89_04915 [Desulfatiglandales bacterium]|nr:hypothetical protein [Desulfatiglandales bacterium]